MSVRHIYGDNVTLRFPYIYVYYIDFHIALCMCYSEVLLIKKKKADSANPHRRRK